MQFVPNQVMGYDRAITVFSPDGRILQVEYAEKAVDSGTLTVGIACKDGVILLANVNRHDKLIVENTIDKIFKLEEHLVTASAGYISDARVLVKKCRIKAQQHKLSYGEEMSAETLAKYVADIEQAYTQYGGIRPFGVSFLIGGVNKEGPKLFVTEPSGIYFQYVAKAVGLESADVNKLLEKNYRENIKIDDGLKLGVSVLKKAFGKQFKYSAIKATVITAEGVRNLSASDLKKY